VLDAPACRATDESTGASFAVEPGQILLDAALAGGIDLAHGCRNGVCGACAVEVLDGADHCDRPDPIESNSLQRFRLPRGARLACRMRVRGSVRIRPA
jgi:CDP-4-dehydro-6-deoxyglucose reductase